MSTHKTQRQRIYGFLRDGRWHDHETITSRAGSDNWASASARVRDLRKDRYGGHAIDRKPNPERPGFWLYRMARRHGSACCIVLMSMLFCLLGCDTRPHRDGTSVTINGNQIDNLPPGSTVDIEGSDDVGSGLYRHDGSASGKGAGLSTESEKVGQSFDASAPRSWLTGLGGSEGGSTSIEQTLTGGSATSPLLWAGILALVGGAVAFYFGLRRAALICGVLGGLLICASFFPQWAFILLGVGGVAAIGFYVYAEHKGKTRDELAASFAWARNDLPPDLKKQFDDFLAKHLNTQGAIDDTKTLAAVQAKQGIV